MWPPWPWPPWDGDEPGDDDGSPEQGNRTEKAHAMAKKILDFETDIAQATLDL